MISRRHISRRQAIAGAMVPALLPAFARADSKPPTLEELLKPAIDRDAALSPDGAHVAVLSVHAEGDKSIASVTVLRADNPDEKPVRIGIGDFDVQRVAWANDQRLLVWFQTAAFASRPQTGSHFTEKRSGGIKAQRILAIDIDGKRQKVLFDDGGLPIREVFDLGRVVDFLPDDPRNILMQVWSTTAGLWDLMKVDVYSGSPKAVERGALDTDGWITQNGRPIVRYDSNLRGTVRSVYLRAPGASEWTLFRRLRRGDRLERGEFSVVGVTNEPGIVLVAARRTGENDVSVRRFDVATATFGDAVATRPGRQFDTVLTSIDNRFLAAGYTDDRIGYEFVDPTMAGHFRGMNSFLGNECNLRLTDVSRDGDRYLAFASGPREPGAFFFYDRKAKRFDGLGQLRPWLAPERLAPMETLKVTTRDGATITAYLTKPLAKGPRPLVVVPHGGPEVRDGYDYDIFAQALAAQGWLVLQPNFRGSGGYGKAFADAGRKRWGDRMQEDVEDAVAIIIASGRVDPGKVAILGYSYGGYAALMGAVRRPDLYKAVVAGAGDADLVEAIAFAKSEDGDRSPSHLYWLETIGDPAVDGAAMRAASPALHAERITAPVLLFHGTADRIVAPKQSQIMAKALRDAGKRVEHVEARGTGHHLDEDGMKLFLTKSVDHIAKAFKA